MAWGTVTIEGATFRETMNVVENGTALRLTGQESTPPLARADVLQLHANVLGLEGRVVPITFTGKPERNGFYTVTSASSELMDWNGGVVTATWTIDAMKIGAGADVEFETRVPTIPRAHDLGAGVGPSYWHAAPVDVLSYFTGTTVPNFTTRASADGAVPVFTSLPVNVAPRWTVGVLDYMRGAVDLRLDGRLALGEMTPPGFSTWIVENGIVQVKKSSTPGGVDFEAWNGSAWSALKTYRFTVNGSALTVDPEFTVLRNDPEETVVRLTFPGVPGRTQVDIGLRRGARFATCQVARHAAAALGITRTASEAGTAVTGGIRATTPDGAGATFILGSARTVTATLTTPALSRANVARADFFIGFTGVEADAAALVSQYLGTNGDRTRVVLR